MTSTGPQNVTITAACPECGGDATWHGTHCAAGDGTTWRIDCGWCDVAAWSLAAQVARRVRRVA